MILTTYQSEDGVRIGIKTERGILDVAAAARAAGVTRAITPDAVYRRGLPVLERLRALVESSTDETLYLDEAELTYAPVVPNPGKIICVGLNYRKHAEETGAESPEFPILFSKFNNALAAPNEDIPMQADWGKVDYESELGVVMGRTARNVSEAKRSIMCSVTAI